ncbi:asparagine synthase (glutamine-hydrolyzing) [Bacillus kwashiorkori]|uniref:asparagine synthase (glutamine-hydrolyzing) n=1 Tax=Bacillus kwashiorkori TaxID=1522318 RepID=UPI000785D2AC|nr:asparagine synthase (glutamine-hydrolyzing) [Bacillus kwashiorkori]
MCGFVGFANSNVTNKEQIIQAMMEAIRHRGPDSGDYFTDKQVTFGFRRLSIIDLTDEASQPMYNEDKSIVLVFNGEIYNFQEIRQQLIEKGHVFKSHSDSEVIVHGYEEFGPDILQKLRGMFAFAIWDKNTESLLLARDHFGIKPLYYTQNTTDQSFLFGSEIKTFLQHPSFQKELNRDALKPYLTFQYSGMDETFFQGVYKLKPGHYMLYKNGTIEIKQYWDIAFNEQAGTEEEYIKRINNTMQESVEYHKISDVKVGSFLSGGVDSSYITALLQPNKTFSVGFKDYEGIFNETNIAQELSEKLNIENHRELINADQCFEKLPEIQYYMDEPQANLSSVPLYFLSQLASKHVTVVLSGEGADEIFAGYDWYRKSKKLVKYEKIPFAIRRFISKSSKLLPKNKLTSFLVKGGQTIEEKFIGQAIIFEESEANDVLTERYQAGPSVFNITNTHYRKVKDKDELTKMQYLDLKQWLPGDILLKADKMSMAHSIELRVPFLDKKVMEMAGEIPSHLRVNEKDTKYVLRKASEKVLPEEWANRKKVGFPVPVRHWLKEDKYYNLVKEMFQRDFVKEFFNTTKLVEMLDEHHEGKHNHARKIWTVYVFLVWYQKYFIEL